ncbi:hypothetical protein [Actinoallomurus rhizosphaericola]|uniref:hypothetical protein n=1 Tax=Actinoallomurus rhizosphaericola TaxID=2952536 RepID=UPI002093FA74|nr:hypothetical protein [Actinoallomurus rhizosphaericola]MCO5996117.1 hypothetical protein [Actinoallomurus rhizosphaericola]
MKIFDLYGIRADDVGVHLQDLSRSLHVEWEKRFSDYIGTYYRAVANQFGASSIEVRPNRLPDENGLKEKGFPEYTFLLYVNRSPRADEIRARLSLLPEWSFLRRDVFD